MSKHKSSSESATGELLQALAEPTRQKIVEVLLKDGELTAAQICEHFRVSNPAISQHLRVLRESGAVVVEKRAQYRVYSVNPDAIVELENWTHALRKMWERRFEALGRVLDKKRVESEEKGG